MALKLEGNFVPTHSVWISTTKWKFDIFMNNAIKIFLALKSLDLCGYGGTIAVFGPVDPSSNPLETRYFFYFRFFTSNSPKINFFIANVVN